MNTNHSPLRQSAGNEMTFAYSNHHTIAEAQNVKVEKFL